MRQSSDIDTDTRAKVLEKRLTYRPGLLRRVRGKAPVSGIVWRQVALSPLPWPAETRRISVLADLGAKSPVRI